MGSNDKLIQILLKIIDQSTPPSKVICFLGRFDYMLDMYSNSLKLVEYNTIAVGMGLHSHDYFKSCFQN